MRSHEHDTPLRHASVRAPDLLFSSLLSLLPRRCLVCLCRGSSYTRTVARVRGRSRRASSMRWAQRRAFCGGSSTATSQTRTDPHTPVERGHPRDIARPSATPHAATPPPRDETHTRTVCRTDGGRSAALCPCVCARVALPPWCECISHRLLPVSVRSAEQS